MWFKADRFQIPVKILLIILFLGCGLIFRLVNLDQKVFWVDEVATVLRAAGYTKQDVTAVLADGTIHTPADLLAYQQLQPDRSVLDAINAFQTSPEHAPLYFLLVRFWMQGFGSSVAAIRSFSVVCSLLLLPAIYRLSYLIFRSVRTAWMTVVLMALSPFFIAYAQEARPYSLWVLTLVLSSSTLWQALRTNSIGTWIAYALALTLSLYTSLLTLGVAIGQGLYVIATERQLNQRMCRFGIAVATAFFALLPWLGLVGRSWPIIQANTTWMQMPLAGFAKAIIWFYSIAILYFDVPVILNPRLIAATEIMVAAGVVAVVGYAFYHLCRQTPQRIWLFILSLALPVPLLLILMDLISNGRYSTAPRYLLPLQLGSQLAVAYLLTHRSGINHRSSQWQWQGIAAGLISLSVFSNFVQVETSPRYLKSRNLHNLPIAAIVNQSIQPLLISESENTIDLLSLSHSLRSNAQLQISSTSVLIQQMDQITGADQFSARSDRTLLLFNPSTELKQQIRQNPQLHLTERYYPQDLLPGEISLSLWQLFPR